MERRLVRDESPEEYFREQLVRALEHQKVATSAFTQYYLVRLLAACVHRGPRPVTSDGYDETPLALLYLQALSAARPERVRLLRAMGDSALFVSGFFADRLTRSHGDGAYYRALGGFAYGRLSREDASWVFGPEVFAELADRFGRFADVLSEVSEASHLQTNRSVLGLYERWLETGSARAARQLAERGIHPVAPGAGPPH
jgi:hypothetical protein